MAKHICPHCGAPCRLDQELWQTPQREVWHLACAREAGKVKARRKEPLKRERPGLGDLVEVAVKPVARALRLKCLDDAGQLRPESKCAQRRDKWNRWGRRAR